MINKLNIDGISGDNNNYLLQINVKGNIITDMTYIMYVQL